MVVYQMSESATMLSLFPPSSRLVLYPIQYPITDALKKRSVVSGPWRS